MLLSLDSLVQEVLGRLIGYCDVRDLHTIRTAGCAWRTRVGAADAVWRECYRARFKRPPQDPFETGWADAYRAALREERNTTAQWGTGNVHQEGFFIFSSFVRSWASDGELLVAGLYNGRLQPLSWRSGRVGRPFQGGHSDEVVCVALNDQFVMSGSGDPGYHNRHPTDSSVKLWTRSGILLASFRLHEETVRGVVLFPSTSGLGNYGLSAGLDSQAVLWSLEAQEPVTTLRLPGPCRSLRLVLPPDWEEGGRSEGPAAVPEARVLAAAGQSVAELALRIKAPGEAAELTLLQVISLRVCLVSSIDCHVSPKTWAELPVGALYPPSLLQCPGATVAGGTTDGRLWALGRRREGCLVPAPPLGGGSGLVAEDVPCFAGGCCWKMRRKEQVVAVEIMEGRQLLAICRTGVLCLAEWTEDISEATVRWAKQGWRMYVSTMRRREPGLLVTDGFDNAIGTLRVGDPSSDGSPQTGESSDSELEL